MNLQKHPILQGLLAISCLAFIYSTPVHANSDQRLTEEENTETVKALEDLEHWYRIEIVILGDQRPSQRSTEEWLDTPWTNQTPIEAKQSLDLAFETYSAMDILEATSEAMDENQPSQHFKLIEELAPIIQKSQYRMIGHRIWSQEIPEKPQVFAFQSEEITAQIALRRTPVISGALNIQLDIPETLASQYLAEMEFESPETLTSNDMTQEVSQEVLDPSLTPLLDQIQQEDIQVDMTNPDLMETPIAQLMPESQQLLVPNIFLKQKRPLTPKIIHFFDHPVTPVFIQLTPLDEEA